MKYMKTKHELNWKLVESELELLSKEKHHWDAELEQCTNENKKVSLRVHQRIASLNYKSMEKFLSSTDSDIIISDISDIKADYPYWSFIKKYHPDYAKSPFINASDTLCRYLYGEEMSEKNVDFIENLRTIYNIQNLIGGLDFISLMEALKNYIDKSNDGLSYADASFREAYNAWGDILRLCALQQGVILFRRTDTKFEDVCSVYEDYVTYLPRRKNRLCVFPYKLLEGSNKGNYYIMGYRSEDAANILGKLKTYYFYGADSDCGKIYSSRYLISVSKEEVDECIKKLEAAGYDVVKYKEIDCDLHDFCVQEVKDGQRQEPCMKGSMEECEAYIQDNGQGREFHIVSEENVVVDQTLNCKTQVSEEETESEEEEKSEYRGFHR